MSKVITNEIYQELLDQINDSQYTLVGDYKSNKHPVVLQCKECGNEFTISAYIAKKKYVNCPCCSDNPHKMNSDGFQKRLDKNNGVGVYKLVGEYSKQKAPVSIQHKCGWIINLKTASSPLKGKINCPICDNNSKYMNTESFKIKVKMKFGDEFIVQGQYVNQSTPIQVYHKTCGKVINVIPYSFLDSKYGCQQCSFQSQRMTHEEFVKKALIISPTIIILGQYFNTKTKVLCKCSLCGYQWNNVANNILSGCGCPVCGRARRIVVGQNDMWTTAPNKAKYLVNPEDGYKYSEYSNALLKFKCLSCGLEKTIKPNNAFNLRGEYSCSCCGDGVSYPEKYFHALLQQLKIDYIYQLSNKDYVWCKSYRYDFYIPYLNTIIELHGEQHYKGFNGYNSLKDIQLNDLNKLNNAIANGITRYITIDCSESSNQFIRNSINQSEFAKLFDLSNIEWKQCGVFASSSLKLKACELWNKGLSLPQISKEIHVCSTTVGRYLKDGVNLQLCDYTIEESKRRGHKIGGSKIGKRVKNKQTNEIFNSTADANSALGKNRYSHAIAMCCRGQRDKAWGYEWEYVS